MGQKKQKKTEIKKGLSSTYTLLSTALTHTSISPLQNISSDSNVFYIEIYKQAKIPTMLAPDSWEKSEYRGKKSCTPSTHISVKSKVSTCSNHPVMKYVLPIDPAKKSISHQNGIFNRETLLFILSDGDKVLPHKGLINRENQYSKSLPFVVPSTSKALAFMWLAGMSPH